MKTILLILGCLGLSVATWAQQTTEKKAGRVGIGLYYNPSFTYRTLTTSTTEGAAIKELRNQQEIFGISQSAGMTVDVRIVPKVRIELGVLYGDRTYRTRVEELQWTDNSANAPSAAYISFHHYYGDIPLKVKYDFLQTDKFNCFAGVGATLSIFGQYNRNTHLKEGNTWRVANKDKNYFVQYDEANFFALVDAGIEYKLSKAFKLAVAINGQIPLKAANSNLELKEYFYSVGLGIGFIYNPLVKVK